MHDEFQHQAPEKKRRLMSGFEKFLLIIFLLIMGYIISDKMGCSPVTTESQIEWKE